MFKNIAIFITTICFLGSSTQAKDFVVMSYNVENFFDAKDDPKTEDETYLPKKHPQKKKCKKIKSSHYRKVCSDLDWTDKKIALKFSQHLKVLKSFPEKVHLLALIEIESPEVVKLFNDSFYLKGMVMSSGNDKRGINVALLFDNERFSLVESTEHSAPFATRNILEVTLKDKVKDKTLTVFVNHWPSQRSPTEKRIELANILVKRLKASDKEKSAIVLGDFNTLDKEFPSPFGEVRKILKDSSDDYQGPGSYFYKRTMSWNLLDRVFYGPAFELKKFSVYNPEFSRGVTEYTQKGPFKGSRIMGIPKGYDHKKEKRPGFSDHFPVYTVLRWN